MNGTDDGPGPVCSTCDRPHVEHVWWPRHPFKPKVQPDTMVGYAGPSGERWLLAVKRRIAQHRGNYDGWAERVPGVGPAAGPLKPAGFLVPTEPDPEERAAIRERLMIAIEELGRLCDELGIKGDIE